MKRENFGFIKRVDQANRGIVGVIGFYEGVEVRCLTFLRLSVFLWCKDRPQIAILWGE